MSNGVVELCDVVRGGGLRWWSERGVNGTGLGGPEAPRLSRGRFAAPRPVPLAGELA